SYQGGHIEFFKYLVDRLRERGAGQVRVYGGGGGTILPAEIEELHAYGVARIFSPEDGRRLGLDKMVRTIVDECDRKTIERLGLDFPYATIGILLVDPTRRRSRGALLGDRIRLNAIHDPCQSDSEIVDLVDVPVYVMTPEYGAPSQLEKIDMIDLAESGKLEEALKRHAPENLPAYSGELPEGHDGFGLRLLGIPGDEVVDRQTYEKIKARVLSTVRGTVQADILKEDQAQNTCIFSTGFALKMMGDIQAYFISNKVRNFYSVSISGYHIAEAGANPISQLAFTLSNGFTYVEYFLSRG